MSLAMDVPPTMRAWVARRYGGPEVLECIEMPTPRPGLGEVAIRVEATTVSTADRRLRAMDFPKGLGLVGRAIFGVTRLRRPVLGVELTGVIAAVGEGVADLRPGDPVIAYPSARGGGHAEIALMPRAGLIVRRPNGMAIETAAALGFGGLTARHYLRRADLRPGESVLVLGAAGTVGSALVQLAREAGARVDAVTSAAHLDVVRDLGAEAVHDRATHDVTAARRAYDIVADAVGMLTFARALPILAEGGRYLAINADLGDMIPRRAGSRRLVSGPAAERLDDLAALTALADEGRFRPLIDQVVPFERIPDAHARVDSGRKRGSIVVLTGKG